MAKTQTIEVPALRYAQGNNTLYSMVIDGKMLFEVARVEHLQTNDAGEIAGFQREEIKSHIKEIRSYIERAGQDAMIPNSVVLAAVKPPRWKGEKGSPIGWVTLPLDQSALIVDGQQRSAAIRDADVADFPMNVLMFVSESESHLAEHFARVNLSRPLNKSVLHSLMPLIEGEINSKLQRERLPVLILTRLNQDDDSPFKGRIKTAVTPAGFISEGNVQRMLQESLTNGYLFNLREDENIERMVQVVKNFWEAVVSLWPTEWDLPPVDSRLTHAAGIMGLGHLMDQIADMEENPEKLTRKLFLGVLKKMKHLFHWTEGSGDWDFGVEGRRPWNGVEATVKSVMMMKAMLKREYRKLDAKERKGNVTEGAA